MRKIELLSPAKDLAIGMTAIRNGADAIYIGAPAFGARRAAANSIEDLKILVDYAHRFYCRVFVTLNTILYDNELAEAEKLIKQLYKIGVDALIIQDMGILKMNLPPISLHASTQMHNYDLEQIKFLDKIGFQRIVLARELSLEQIKIIRREVKAELEVFIHGALCVSLSGQCYLSQYMFGRSANRGECAQPCRMKWTVKDQQERIVIDDRYVLSLKDLNLSYYINDLIQVGVDSFKIEGRLKDENYVANITNHYSSLINKNKNIERVGSGQVVSAFTAEPERSFNRGYSAYFIAGRKEGLVNMDTPKSVGKYIGKILQAKGNRLQLEAIEGINNGDGLCYVEDGELKGMKVNGTEGDWVICNEPVRACVGTRLFRNYDHRFVMQIEKAKSVRKIRIRIQVKVENRRLYLEVTDEDGVRVCHEPDGQFDIAENPVQKQRLEQQLVKCGDTDFICEDIQYLGNEILFVPSAFVNAARRCLLERLETEREKRREVMPAIQLADAEVGQEINWHYNVVNCKAEEFYREHGALQVDSGFENSSNKIGQELMRTRYCLLHELGRCRKLNSNDGLVFPLYLCNDKHQFRIEFDCEQCFMKIFS